MSKPKKYIVGTSPMPTWCYKSLMQFKKMDGTTGYEWNWHDGEMWRRVELFAGDTLINANGEIHFKRR